MGHIQSKCIRRKRRSPLLVAFFALSLAFALGQPAGEVRAELPEEVSFDFLDEKPFLGDLPEMLARGRVRVLVPYYDKTNFLIVDGRARGFEHRLMTALEQRLNDGRGRKDTPISVVFNPVPASELLTALVEGRGDIAAAGLTVTPARQARVAFSKPYFKNIAEVLVSRLDRPPAGSLDALSGREVHVRRDSSYAEHLRETAAEMAARGLAPVRVIEADAHFQTADLLQMVHGGLIDYTIADQHKAELWARVLPNLRVESDVAISQGNQIAWAVRKDSVKLREKLDWLVDRIEQKFAREMEREFTRYFASAQFVSEEHPIRLSPNVREIAGHFRRHARRYEMDWLLMFAQGYQESRLDPTARSRVGAIGVMQLLPSTAKDMGFEDVTEAEPNIHAGIKYMRWILDRYYKDPEIEPDERVFFALAGYNAGPGRIAKLRRRAPEMGLDPNRWFGNMELVILANIGSEPVGYVSNIYKYYVGYSRPMFKLHSPEKRQEQVEKIQRLLTESGYPAGPADGIVGRQTREAIRAYQGANGLTVDGRPSVILLLHLERARAAPA